MKQDNLDYENCKPDGHMHLCYVDAESDDTLLTLYFSDIPARFNWGDDWDDAPYEHNAGTPYSEYTTDEMEPDGKQHKYFPLKIEKIIIEKHWYSDIQLPCSGALNSKWTVEDINNKLVPWMIVVKKDETKEPIWADETMEQVMGKLKETVTIYKQV